MYKAKINISNGIKGTTIIIFSLLVIFVLCVSFDLTYNSNINHTKIVIGFDDDSAKTKKTDSLVITNKTKNNEIDVYLNHIESFEYLGGDLIIENTGRYKTANSRTNLIISGKYMKGDAYVSEDVGALIDLGDYKIKVVGIYKEEDEYILQLRIFVINPQKLIDIDSEKMKKKFMKYRKSR